MKEKKFKIDIVDDIVKALFQDCGVEKLLIEESKTDFTLTIQETVFDWQLRKLVELFQKYPFLTYSLEPNEGLVIYEGEGET